MSERYFIRNHFYPGAEVCLYLGKTMDFLKSIPNEYAQLIVTSPPYNIGKEYEKKKPFENYLKEQEEVIIECVRLLKKEGNICWQVGDYTENGETFPLDIYFYDIFKKLGLKLRNRIIWWFSHGAFNPTNKFSPRYETILWFSKSNNYYFNLDPVRIPQKYPGKQYPKEHPKAGEYSGNPLGKNPTNVWEIPNVKAKHCEKTEHPCQFPVGLIERLVLSMTKEKDLVIDPYIGSGTTAIAALKNNRKIAGVDKEEKYINISKKRINDLGNGNLKTRPMNMSIFQPNPNNPLVKSPFKKIIKNLLL